jgi:hypothetical protein
MIASGSGFGATNVATKLMADAFGGGHYAKAAVWAVIGLAAGVAATVTGMTAFQRRRATTVVPVTTSVQTFLPIVLEPFFLRENWGAAAYGGAPVAGGLLIALVGTTLLSKTDVVADLAAGGQSG